MTQKDAKPLGLDLDEGRPASPPRAAATVIALREGEQGVEVFCVRRHQNSAFLGGAVVFPGGKVDDADRDPAFADRCDAALPRARELADDDEEARAITIAAARELLEEAELFPAKLDAEGVRRLRADAATSTLAAAVDAARVRLELSTLWPFARWVTPTAEPRRFDARFFVLAVPSGQVGRHDEHETTHSFWATPRDVLRMFERGEIQLAPPTTRSLEILSGARSLADARRIADAQSLRPVCPELVHDGAVMLTLPGDPRHSERDAVLEGPSRFVLRDGRFVSEDP